MLLIIILLNTVVYIKIGQWWRSRKSTVWELSTSWILPRFAVKPSYTAPTPTNARDQLRRWMFRQRFKKCTDLVYHMSQVSVFTNQLWNKHNCTARQIYPVRGDSASSLPKIWNSKMKQSLLSSICKLLGVWESLHWNFQILNRICSARLNVKWCFAFKRCETFREIIFQSKLLSDAEEKLGAIISARS